MVMVYSETVVRKRLSCVLSVSTNYKEWNLKRFMSF